MLRHGGLRLVAESLEKRLHSVCLTLEKSKSFCMICQEDDFSCPVVADLGFQQAHVQVAVLGSELLDDILGRACRLMDSRRPCGV